MPDKRTISYIKNLKGKRPIVMLTAYDYPLAELLDKAGIDIILVGDSLANVVLGLDATNKIGMTEMVYHTKTVTRAARNALVIADMPYEAYQPYPQRAVENARRFIDETGCDAVKIEWFPHCLEVTRRIIEAGIPVMGHIGLTPQTAEESEGFKVRGKNAEAARALVEQAVALEKEGCFALVIECVPDKITARIAAGLTIPVIGIGAGPHCDGQVLVTHDILGLFDRFKPKFVKRYIDLNSLILKAVEAYKEDVLQGSFPAAEHSFTIKDEEYKKAFPEAADS